MTVEEFYSIRYQIIFYIFFAVWLWIWFINDWGQYLIYEQRHLSYSWYLSWKFLVYCLAMKVFDGISAREASKYLYTWFIKKYPNCGFCEIWALVCASYVFHNSYCLMPRVQLGNTGYWMDLKWVSTLNIYWELNISHALF